MNKKLRESESFSTVLRATILYAAMGIIVPRHQKTGAANTHRRKSTPEFWTCSLIGGS